jgi:hypothetical protein
MHARGVFSPTHSKESVLQGAEARRAPMPDWKSVLQGEDATKSLRDWRA